MWRLSDEIRELSLTILTSRMRIERLKTLVRNLAKKELTATVYLLTEDGEKLFNELTENEKNNVIKKMSKNLTESMSLYYTQHPEEFEVLLNSKH